MLQNMSQRDLLIGGAVALGLLVLAPLALLLMGLGSMMGLGEYRAGGMMGPSAFLPGLSGPLLRGWLLAGIGVLLCTASGAPATRRVALLLPGKPHWVSCNVAMRGERSTRKNTPGSTPIYRGTETTNKAALCSMKAGCPS